MPENRTSAGHFKKGVTGNPGGRPSGFALLIREKSLQGEELVDFAFDVLRAKVSTRSYVGKGVSVELPPSIRERFDAMRWLSDRGWGKVADVQPDEFANLTNEQIVELLQMELRRRNEAQSTEGAPQ